MSQAMSSVTGNLYDFKNPVVRDLAWVMLSPSLVKHANDSACDVISDGYCNCVYHENYQWLCELDLNPGPLDEFLSRRKYSRLGFYFEDLLAFWLENKVRDGYFESHVKVSSSERDLGEFDFLFRKDNVYQHWEAAVKFYLYYCNTQGEVSWYGPNANDTLEKKLKKLINHQVRLSKLPEAKKILSERAIKVANISARIFLKGYLFYPLNQSTMPVSSTVRDCLISSAHSKGWWSSVDNIDHLMLVKFSAESLRWQQLPRQKWLAPRIYDPEEGEELLKPGFQLIQNLREHFNRSGESILVAAYSASNNGQWLERTRGFVVSQGWPD